ALAAPHRQHRRRPQGRRRRRLDGAAAGAAAFPPARHRRRHRPDPRLHPADHHLHRPRRRARRGALIPPDFWALGPDASRSCPMRNITKIATFLFTFLVPAIVLAAPAETSGSERSIYGFAMALAIGLAALG